MSANFSLYCFGSIHDSDMPPVICKYISSGKYTSCVILYSTCKFWGENCTDPGCGDTRSSHPLPPGKSPRHVWSVENHHELAAFPWVGGNSTQENQGAINKLYLSTQFYFPFSSDWLFPQDRVKCQYISLVPIIHFNSHMIIVYFTMLIQVIFFCKW